MRKIGIFGGSFNPIHVGHAIIASHVLRQGLVDQLWLMVTPENPFKSGQRLASEDARLRMTEMVTRRIPGAVTSAFEMQLPRPSYTIDTLRALQAKFPDDEFHLLIGADNWAAWERWKEADEIVARHHVLVYPRLGFEVVIPPALANRVALVDAPIIEISSTQVRELLAAGKSAAFYVPDDVEQFATRHKIYNNND
ncbi:MAG: nicotinate-nucleotide adenylyltransferase [Muribaculaceae bacterium]|nr:nicotinate-nucleotide adenylyltransferase [Muribaculaceae bacterium]